MRLPEFSQRIRIPSIRIPRVAFSLGLPLGIFLIMLGVGFGTGDSLSSSGDADANANDADTAVVVASPTATPVATATAELTPVPTFEPTATVLPDRTTCSEIQGTDYRSATEHTWYLENCVTVATAGTEPPQPVNTNPAPVSGYVGAQTPLGDRLVIPSIGVNADVSGVLVGPSGVMPDPSGYFNVVWYDFKNFPGLGGYATGGNLVIAGHVDSAVYGAVVFYNLSQLQAGAIIEYHTSDGQLYRYEVTGAGDYLPSDNWAGIVASSTADITLISCVGSFNTSIAGEYSHRRAVFGKRL